MDIFQLNLLEVIAMRTVVHTLCIGAVLLSVVFWTAGCSLIGYAIGGAIDGDELRFDSVVVTKKLVRESPSLEPQPVFDQEQMFSILKKVPPEQEKLMVCAVPPGPVELGVIEGVAHVEVVTQEISGVFSGSSLIVDTILAPTEASKEAGLFPGELVVVSYKGREIPPIGGKLTRVTDQSLVLRVGEENRGIALATISSVSVYRSDGTMIGVKDLTLSQSSEGMTQIPGLLIVEHDPPVFFPFATVDEVRVFSITRWGPTRTTMFVTGGVLDFVCCSAIAKYPLLEPERPTSEAVAIGLGYSGLSMLLWVMTH